MNALRTSIVLLAVALLTVPAFAAVTPAADVSAGSFGANTGGGNYTFPANLTVDTNTFFVNATSNRVGIGTTSPAALFHVNGTAFFGISAILSSGSSLIGKNSMEVQRFNNGAPGDAANITMTGSRGIEGAPAANANGDEIARFLFRGFDGTTPVSSARLGTIVDGAVSAGVVPQAMTFKTGTGTPAERMRIDSSGNVGIGGIAPVGKRLFVSGDVQINGALTGTNIAATYQDVAEWVPSSGDLEPGTVVVLNKDRSNEVMASTSSYDTAVAGVVSHQPGLILGERGPMKEQIATTGRVKVRVDASNGGIRVGDLLVTSDRPGVAMRSVPVDIGGRKFHQPGTLIGKALEPLADGEGEILVLLSLQ